MRCNRIYRRVIWFCTVTHRPRWISTNRNSPWSVENFIYYPYYRGRETTVDSWFRAVRRRGGLSRDNGGKNRAEIPVALEYLANRLIAGIISRIKPYGLFRRVPDFRLVRRCLRVFSPWIRQITHPRNHCYTVRGYWFDLVSMSVSKYTDLRVFSSGFREFLAIRYHEGSKSRTTITTFLLLLTVLAWIQD